MYVKMSNWEKNTYDEIVSLGAQCEVGISLNSKGLRKEAYPFDWMISPLSFISRVIKNKIKSIDINSLKFVKGQDHCYLSNNEIILVHDFDDFSINGEIKKRNSSPPEINPDIDSDSEQKETSDNELVEAKDAVFKKYQRRLERFHTLLMSNKKVLFVRQYMANHPYLGIDTQEDIIELIELIETMYPNLNFDFLNLCDINDDKGLTHPKLQTFPKHNGEGPWAHSHRLMDWFRRRVVE